MMFFCVVLVLGIAIVSANSVWRARAEREHMSRCRRFSVELDVSEKAEPCVDGGQAFGEFLISLGTLVCDLESRCFKKYLRRGNGATSSNVHVTTK